MYTYACMYLFIYVTFEHFIYELSTYNSEWKQRMYVTEADAYSQWTILLRSECQSSCEPCKEHSCETDGNRHGWLAVYRTAEGISANLDSWWAQSDILQCTWRTLVPIDGSGMDGLSPWETSREETVHLSQYLQVYLVARNSIGASHAPLTSVKIDGSFLL